MIVGAKPRLTAYVYDATQKPAALKDPTDIVLKVKDPLGVVTAFAFSLGQIVRDAVGTYHVDYQTVNAGLHLLHWQASGAVTAVAEPNFTTDAATVT